MSGSCVSIVIPAWEEREHLPKCLARLREQEAPVEVLVVDGGSTDGTPEAARAFSDVVVLEGPRGRARQMNEGARLARGDLLWFLHADSLPAPGSVAAIRRALANPRVRVGAFRFRLDGSRIGYRVVEAGVSLRTRWLRLPFGDQGLFVRRTDFEAIGGYREIPLFEDVRLVREMRRKGRLALLDLPLVTSARRWESNGLWATTLLHWRLLALERLGVGPERLARVREGAAPKAGGREAGR